MKTVYLQRQGVSNNFHIRQKEFCAEVYQLKDGWHVEFGHEEETTQSQRKPWRNDYQQDGIKTLAEVRQVITAKVKEILGIDIEVAEQIEAYMYHTDKEKKLWPHVASDVFVNVQARYEPETDTIRKVPENYCLIAWQDGDIHKPIFDVDAATMPYREVCQKAHAEFIKSHNQRNSDHENKEWLAWLISEYIKKGVVNE